MSVGKLKRYSLPFANVAPSNTATAVITPGRTIESLRFKIEGTFSKAMMLLIRVKVNAKTVIEISGDQLDRINNYKGKSASANFIDLDLADYRLNNEYDRMIGAWDTSVGVSNISVEVNIGAATAPRMTLILVESAQQKTVSGDVAPFAGLMTKLLRYPYNISAGGKLAIPVPFGAQGTIVKRAHFFHGGQMVACVVKQDGLTIHESVTSENNYDALALGYFPQTNLYTVDFASDGAVNKSLDTRDVRSLEWIPEFAAADTGTLVLEVLDPLGNL